MSTALAVKPSPDTAAALDKLFDFEASHARATARLRKALDGNGAAAADLQSTKRWHRMEGAVVALTATMSWSSCRNTYAGKVKGNIDYVSEADLEQAYRRHFDAYSEQAAHVETIVAKLAASPAAGFSAGERIELGGIPLAFASQRLCDCCNGYGQLKCTNCFTGRKQCMTCYGKQRIWTGSAYIACPSYCSYGEVNCSHCFGTTRIGCGACNTKGIFTTVWTGTIHAKVACEIRTPEGRDEAWTKSLTKSGHAWLAEAGIVGKPRISKGEGVATIVWTVDVPVLGQTFRIGEKDYRTQYVGRRERMWSLPRFLDDLVQPLAARIGAAQPAEAFKLAEQAPVFAVVSRGVLHAPRTDDAVAGDFENAVSTSILAGVRGRLEAKRDGIARSTISSVWKYAGAALTAGSLIALASGQTRSLLGAALPDLQRSGMEGSVAVVGGMVLAALLAATWLLAGLAGRSAVRTVLQTRAARMPDQGRAPAYAVVAALAVYSAGAYFVVPGATPPSTRTAGVAAASRMPVVQPPTIPPFYR